MAFDLKTWKQWLGLPCAYVKEDALLQSFLDDVVAAWKRATARPRFFDGDTEGTFYFEARNPYEDAIPMKHRPVIAVTNVWLDEFGAAGQNPDGFDDSTLLEAGVDYFVDNLEANEENPGLLVNLTGAAWPTTRGSIKFTGKVGYTEAGLPKDVEAALFNAATIMRATAPQGGLLMGSERIGNYSYQLFSGGQAAGGGSSPEFEDTLSSVRATVRRYREPAA